MTCMINSVNLSNQLCSALPYSEDLLLRMAFVGY